MRQREDSLAQQSVQHAAEVSSLSTTCEVLRAQLQAMHASVGAMHVASRPASPLCNESATRSTSALLMCEHVAVAALCGEVAAAQPVEGPSWALSATAPCGPAWWLQGPMPLLHTQMAAH